MSVYIEGDPPVCPYCGETSKLVESQVVYGYGRDFGPLWLCPSWPRCDSYVGCHKGTTWPLGRMANAALRELKSLAHQYFDALWKAKAERAGGSKTQLKKARTAGYKWLADQLGMTSAECHIGMFDDERCLAVIRVCLPFFKRGVR